MILMLVSAPTIAADGSSTDPFTQLGMARNVSSAGVYYFNLGGNAFSTYVDADGYVQVAIDFGNGVGNLPAGTSLTNLTRGILNPSTLLALTDSKEIRLSHSGGGINATNTSTTLISRVVNNITLHQGLRDNALHNGWVGTNNAYLRRNASSNTPFGVVLNSNIVHIRGDPSTFRWIPSQSRQRVNHTLGEIPATESLHLWVRADAVDYGDAPDSGAGTAAGDYETLQANNGPSHTIITGLAIGTAPDTDSDGFANGTDANSNASDDDSEGSADEGSISFGFLFDTDTSYSLTGIAVTNTSGANATLYGWIDFDQNGSFDEDERASATVSNNATTADLNWTSLPGIVSGTTYARFRLATATDLTASGTAATADAASLSAVNSGEVEDYQLTIELDDDGDGIPNGSDQCPGGNDNADNDSDGVADHCDIDDDNDGILDSVEGKIEGATPATAFTSLGMARNVTSAGTYYFNLNGDAFSTYVDNNGYVQVAIDLATMGGALPAGTALTNAARGILNPTTLAALTDAIEVRISHSAGTLDITTTNATLISRVRSNTTIHGGLVDNVLNDSWSGIGAVYATNNAICNTSFGLVLSSNIFHVCGIYNAIVWIPNASAYSYGGIQSVIWDTEITGAETLNMWVRAAAVPIPIAPDTDGDTIVDHLDINSDNDGILDNIEAQTDTGYIALNTDSAATYTANNGVNSAYLGGLTPVDTDSGESSPDNIPDYRDLDSDDDGIPDNVEWQPTTGYQAYTTADSDDDGWHSPYDLNAADAANDAAWGGTQELSDLQDTDADGQKDYRDTDSDDDTKLDNAEGGSTVTDLRYADPNGSVDDPTTDLPNETGDTTEVAYREEASDITISGSIWRDNGANTTNDATAHNGDGGSANDGTSQETGIGEVPVAACLANGTVLASGITSADGSYELIIAASAVGQSVDIVAGNASGYLSVSEHTGPNAPVLPGLDNAQTSISCDGITATGLDTLRFTPAAGENYPEIDFGDVLPPGFEPDNQSLQAAGSVALYPHIFTAQTTGDVTFTTASSTSPVNTGWTEVLYQDANCNGELDTGESLVSGAISVVAEEQVCLVAKVVVPSDAANGSRHQLVITADFDYTGTSLANIPLTVMDLTTVAEVGGGVLELIKLVENMTATSPYSDSGVEQTINSAQPGDELRYVIYFRNSGLKTISDVSIFDSTPAFTALKTDVICPTPLPASLTACTVTIPAAAANDPGYEGPIAWGFEGTLAPGAEASVEYRVIVQ